ncbi:serine/arginine repetitive matrix protein 1-like [Mustela erminea]|uniref:serine/arginine repetitive matrix protein 1-like n=1 Tax=Mustela erminea TaxID=36723 RepID=UPI001386BF33|nr:serine/arginine repetitive matrix protein 1-like [Mustela erminea]
MGGAPRPGAQPCGDCSPGPRPCAAPTPPLELRSRRAPRRGRRRGRRSVAKPWEALRSRAVLQVSAGSRRLGSRGPGSHGRRAGVVTGAGESVSRLAGDAGRARRQEAAGGIGALRVRVGRSGHRPPLPRRRPCARARAPAGAGVETPYARRLRSPPPPPPARVPGVVAASPLPPGPACAGVPPLQASPRCKRALPCPYRQRAWPGASPGLARAAPRAPDLLGRPAVGERRISSAELVRVQMAAPCLPAGPGAARVPPSEPAPNQHLARCGWAWDSSPGCPVQGCLLSRASCGSLPPRSPP